MFFGNNFSQPNQGFNPLHSNFNSGNFYPINNPIGSNTAAGSNQYFYVNGIEGARAFFVPANSSVLLLDSDSNMFYIKTSNSSGQSSIKNYTYSEVDTNKNTKYVSREEFEQLKNIVFQKQETQTANKTRKMDKSIEGEN